jgi:hypothetical protein
MKRNLLFFLIFSLFSIYLAAQAKLEFEKTEINFGEINEGEAVSIEFKFKNSGDQQLMINGVRPSCGCTVARLKQRKYKPGEEGVIPVRFMSSGYGGIKVFKTITVTSNDLKHPSVRLVITGNVSLTNFARIEVSPDKIDFNKVRIGKSYSKTISIKNSGNKDLEIIEVTHIPDVTLVFSDSIIKPNGSTRVKIIYKPTRKTENSNFIRFRTNAHRQYYSLVKIDADVKD